MENIKYEIGHAYYQMGFAFEWGIILPIDAPYQSPRVVVIETWLYQGYFKLDWNTTDCDIPHHFYVFQPFLHYENTLMRPPEKGLKIPSFYNVESSMLSFTELQSELAELEDIVK